MKSITLALLIFCNLATLAFSQDRSVIDREMRDIQRELFHNNNSYNQGVASFNALVERLNTNHTPTLYQEYLSESQKLDDQKTKMNELKSRLSHLQEQKKLAGNQVEQRAVEQLTKLEETFPGADIFTRNDHASARSLPLYKRACTEARDMRRALPHRSASDFQEKLQLVLNREKNCYVEGIADEETGVIQGFVLKNTHSAKINPAGSRSSFEATGPSREFYFSFNGRSRQNMHLSIKDDVALTGFDSSDTMMKSMIFIPRKIFPYIEINEADQDCCHTKVYLPTGEFALFDRFSKQIVDGVLKELPIDRSTNRHTRKFAQIIYSGNGITIEASRRGGSPERTHKASYNSNENIKQAIIKHKGEVCKVSKSVIWEGTNGTGLINFKYNTDQEFLDQVINRSGANGCNWNLTMADII